MTEKPKPGWGREAVFALDWLGLAKKGALGDVLRLFSLRYAWLQRGDQQAYRELVRARRAADPDIRQTAEIILAEVTTEKQENGPSDE
jgi:hypothetical protein